MCGIVVLQQFLTRTDKIGSKIFIFVQTSPLSDKEFLTVLQTVTQHWQQSANTYTEYMENGKTFRYALILKLHNMAVNKLLTDNIALVPEEYVKDVEAIIEHYTIWTAKWDELKEELNPVPDDVFIFQNEHRFPRGAAHKLEAALNRL